MSFAIDFEAYKNNMSPGMLQVLSNLIGLPIDAIEKVGVGFSPKDNAWVMPERNAKGDIIGLSYREISGNKKWFVKGSKRGLTYIINNNAFSGTEQYKPGRSRWIRIYKYKDLTCPICNKPDWCMVSSDDPYDPSAVICGRIQKGSVAYYEGSGYLHIRKENKSKKNGTVLPDTDLPILIVEGWSDVVAATALGFIAIGKPTATGGHKLLKEMPLAGRTVYILGENDAGAGKEGMEKTFLTLSEKIKNLKRAQPPTGVKDLRQWYTQLNVTQEQILEYFNTSGTSGGLDDVFENDMPITIAERFLREKKMYDGVFTLRNYRGQWMEWNSNCYEEIDLSDLRGQLYRYLENRNYAKPTINGVDIIAYKATRSKVNDIIDAMNAFCVITANPPVWLDNSKANFKRLIVFNNGVLDVDEYIKGNIVIHTPTPKLFSYNALPYDYDKDADCEEWHLALKQIFNDDEKSIKLLQQWMGYLLLPDMSFEKFMMFEGPPRSGKGTIIESISAMLGTRNCASTTLKSLAGRFDYQKFMGKLAVFLPDVKAPRIHETPYLIERILQITGGDPINIDRKFLTELASIHLTCRFTLAVNEIPQLPDYTSALVSRLIGLRFPNSYVGREDTQLKTRLKRAAAQGKLINFALEGLKSLLTMGKFIQPDCHSEIERSFLEINNPIWAFYHECCKPEKNRCVPIQMVYDAWRTWCNQSNIRPGTKAKFIRRFLSVVPGLKKSRKQLNYESGDDRGRVYVYNGLDLQSWVKDIMGGS